MGNNPVDEIEALIENSGLIVGGIPHEKMMAEMSREDIYLLCNQLSEITSIDKIEYKSSFTHSASLSLSGGRTPCACFGCRDIQITSLIQFASFYSDTVFTYNFFGDYLINHGQMISKMSDEKLKVMFKKDVTLFSRIYPLICKGYILPVTLPGQCPRCHNIRSLNGSSKSDFIGAQTEIEEIFLQNIEYHLKKCGSDLAIYAFGPENILTHGREHFHFDQNINIYNELDVSPDDLNDGGSILLNKSQVVRKEFHKQLAQNVFKSVGFELTSSAKLNASYLSDRDLEFNIIQKLNNDPFMLSRSQLMQKYLTCFVPFINNIDAHSLIKLRNDEGEAFIIFRSSLIKAINEFKASNSTFTESDAKMVFADIVEPNLAKLELKIKSAGSKFVKDTRREILGWVGAISAGLYAGYLSADATTGSLTFGAVKAASDFLNNSMKNSDVEEGIKDNEMYFLWKVKKLQGQ